GPHDVWLLPQILGDQLPGPVQGYAPVAVQRAHYELWAVQVVQLASRPVDPRPEGRHRLAVVARRHQVVEENPVGDLAGQLQHAGAGGPDVDGNVTGLPAPVHHVDLHVGEVDELPVEVDPLHRQQAPGGLDRLAHGLQGPVPFDPDLGSQWVPPGP